MRLVQFEEGGHRHVGIETDQNSDIVDFTKANPDVLTMIQFLKDCEKNMEDAKRCFYIYIYTLVTLHL